MPTAQKIFCQKSTKQLADHVPLAQRTQLDHQPIETTTSPSNRSRPPTDCSVPSTSDKTEWRTTTQLLSDVPACPMSKFTAHNKYFLDMSTFPSTMHPNSFGSHVPDDGILNRRTSCLYSHAIGMYDIEVAADVHQFPE